MDLQPTTQDRQAFETGREGIYAQTRSLLQDLNPESWLDFGCGTGSLLARNEDLGRGCGYDSDPAALELAEQRGLNIFHSWDEVPEVDLIVSVDVIEHMAAEDLLAWLHRWHQKLKPGGRLLLASVNPQSMIVWCEFWHAADHVRPYTPYCLKTMAQAAGFAEQQVTLRNTRRRKRLSLRLIGRILRRLDILPPMGSEFDRYWITYVRQ